MPFPLPCAAAVSGALVLVGVAASGVTEALGAGEALCALVVVVGSALLGVVAAGSLVVLVPEEFPLSARARAGETRKAAKARMQTESARSASWMRLERVDVSHVGVLTAPNRSPFKPNRKKSPLPLSPEKASVDLVARSYSSTFGHSIGPRRDNTNETPRCSHVCETPSTHAKTRPSTKVFRASTKVFRAALTVCDYGRRLSPGCATPLFIRR